MPGDPFQIESLPDAPLRSAALAAARPLLSWVLRLRAYRSIYAQISAGRLDTRFETRALAALDIQPICPSGDAAAIPTRGPLVIASNHPHGALDGLALASVLRTVRPDIRVLTNHLLSRIPELASICFFVDPFGGPGASARSRAGLRAAHLWLRNGGALIVFPAGEVAHERRADGSYADSPWLSTMGRMVLATGAKVVPAFIAGTNSKWFYAAGHIHASLRTALLARELLNKCGQRVAVRLGPALSPRDRTGVEPDATTTTQSIRAAMERLGETVRLSADTTPALPAATNRSIASSCVDPCVVSGFSRTGHQTDAIESEIARLSQASCLAESGAFQVFLSDARQIPAAMREIGRLREVTYRAIGEGTGRELDLDAFDDHYLHLFSWDQQRRRVVGAYRIGRTDRIMATHGLDGLYTRTLFRYDERLIARLSPALELGRSFVRVEYQKNYSALLLLWKGIGQFVARHPQYRVLFGPVSISARYSDHSHRLLMAFLQQNHRHADLADLVNAINPSVVTPAPTDAIPRSIEEANRLVAQSEADGKGVPILLRQYLKLNAKLLGFNVDPQFGDALDALMMVDLAAADFAILNRYLGRQEAAQFLARHHGVPSRHAA